MDPIVTEEQFRALLPSDLGSAKLEMFRFEPERVADAVSTMEPIRVFASVVAGWYADNQADALRAAQATLDVVKGRQTLVRVAPEADTKRDVVTGKIIHAGYVRFGFLNQPGECHGPVERAGEMRYISFGQ